MDQPKKSSTDRTDAIETFSHESLLGSEVTEGALEVWRGLPEIIRQDPSLASFRQEHERLHGDQDPLPSEDADENFSQDEHQTTQNATNNRELISINVINDLGETKPVETDIKVAQNGLNEAEENDHIAGHKEPNKWYHRIKIGALLAVWLTFTILLMSNGEKVLQYRQMSVPVNGTKNYILPETPLSSRIGIYLKGAFHVDHDRNATNFLHVYVQLLTLNTQTNATEIPANQITYAENLTSIHTIPIVSVDQLDQVPETKRQIVFNVGDAAFAKVHNEKAVLRVQMSTDLEDNLPLVVAYDPSPIDKDAGVIYAAIVLLGLYVMIIWEIVHRTFAAMVASTLSLAILAAMNEKPSMGELMGWIDVETLLLLFGMMILVAILSETGIFDFLAVYAYKITGGQVWPLINCLCIFTAVLSSFLDNVTTVLLMTPVSIRLCEVMGLNPVPILMAMIIYSNVGGALTPVGDPPNVIIASNAHIVKGGVNFLTFTVHMSIGIAMVMVQTFFHIKYKFRNMNDLRFTEPSNIQELRHEISVWQRAAASLSSYSKDEDLVRETLLKKVNRLTRQLKKRIASGSVPAESYKATLDELQAKYPIRNKTLLVKSAVTLVFVITFFFLHSVPSIQRLSLGWTALLGAILLLILADREDMEAVLARVEWSTLLFFAALFILMESLAVLGLIEWIGRQTEGIILACSEESRLAVAILIILWVSAIASAFVDNIPLTTMMVKIAISLSENKALGLPLQPLVWALAFGACLGGNGTLIGASANVVCAGVAEQHGYRFTFVEYFKVGFPIMIGSILVATVYLMISHVLFAWH
ncbi:hypothetical protein HA402_009452 [Bradysia odoriphaga]|nr:hypothetical protein HA402_009452 [Bradysia odoriphaga]